MDVFCYHPEQKAVPLSYWKQWQWAFQWLPTDVGSNPELVVLNKTGILFLREMSKCSQMQSVN